MEKVFENVLGPIVVDLIKKFLPNLVKQFEVAIVAHLREAAKDTTNKVDDAVVEAVASVWGVA